MLHDVGEIAGVEGVAVVHRNGAAPLSAPARPRSSRAGRCGRRPSGRSRRLQVLRQADADVDEFAARAGHRHVVGVQIGVGVDEGLLDRLRERARGRSRGALKHRRNDDAARAHSGRRRNSPRRSGPCRSRACDIRSGRGRATDRGRAPSRARRRDASPVSRSSPGSALAAVVGPEPVDDEARRPSRPRIARGDFSVAAEIAEARRPGQGHHVIVERRAAPAAAGSAPTRPAAVRDGASAPARPDASRPSALRLLRPFR